MEDLPFYANLNATQKSYAEKIAAQAQRMGISPKLAVSIAYQESRLNPNVGTGGAGEIGIMQIKPTTAEEVGIAKKELADPDKNIEAGLRYLKKSLELSQGDERLAAAGYNAGINHPFFTPKGNKLPDTTVQYLMSLKSYGAFSPVPAAEPAAPAAEGPPVEEVDESKARAMGELAGGATGAGVAARRALTDVARAGGRRATQSLADAVQQRLTGAAAPTGPRQPAAPIGGSMATSLAEDPLQARILQGTIEPETGATGRARMGGFNIETAQQAARAKQAAQNVGALQRAGVVAQGAPDVLAAAPGMTSSPSGVLYPRTPASSVPMPTPPARGALEEVTAVFRRMLGPETSAGRFGGALMRYGAPPLSLYQAGSETGAMMSELDRPEVDKTMVGLRGLGALGAFGSMFPATAPVSLPIAIGAPAFASAIEEGRKRPLGQVSDVVAP